MLYRHIHSLLSLEGYERDTGAVGTTFRVRPADGDAPDTQHRYALWTTLTTRGAVSRQPRAPETESEDKPPERGIAQLIVETSADGVHWVVLDRHDPQTAARTVRVPYLLPFVRARVRAQGVQYEARALLVGTGPFSLQRQVERTAPIVVVGRS